LFPFDFFFINKRKSTIRFPARRQAAETGHDDEIPEDAGPGERYPGAVAKFLAYKGYGFIEPAGSHGDQDRWIRFTKEEVRRRGAHDVSQWSGGGGCFFWRKLLLLWLCSHFAIMVGGGDWCKNFLSLCLCAVFLAGGE
jgi:cold shock CspA family protein